MEKFKRVYYEIPMNEIFWFFEEVSSCTIFTLQK